MRDLTQIRNAALFFALGFVLLASPWPGSRERVGALFRAESGMLLGCVLRDVSVRVEKNSDPTHPWLDSRFWLTDSPAHPTGATADVKGIGLDSRSLGWMPHAMIIALMAATPMAWSHRLRMMLGSLLIVHVFVGTTVIVSIGSVLYTGTPPQWRSLLFYWADSLLIQNLWISFVVPTLVWIGALLIAIRKGYLGAHPREA